VRGLLEATFAGPDGPVRMPLGSSPAGILIITESGDFTVHVMRAHQDHMVLRTAPT
jgi:hypothetical protein